MIALAIGILRNFVDSAFRYSTKVILVFSIVQYIEQVEVIQFNSGYLVGIQLFNCILFNRVELKDERVEVIQFNSIELDYLFDPLDRKNNLLISTPLNTNNSTELK